MLQQDSGGFADPVEETASDAIVGDEGESPAPKAAFERSPIKVLKSLEDQPFKQAVKVIEYVDALEQRKAKYLKACSSAALSLVAQNGPKYLAAIEATQA